MICVRNIKEMAIVATFVIQMMNTLPLGLCFCPKCACSKGNFYNTLNLPYSGINYQNGRDSVLYPSTPCSCNNEQNANVCSQPINTAGSSGACNEFLFNTQIPPNDPPVPRYSYPYATDTPPTPCPPSFKNFGYQLQVPSVPEYVPNFGSVDSIIDKTYKRCTTCPCHPVK